MKSTMTMWKELEIFVLQLEVRTGVQDSSARM
jgi:hypothetical protein